MSTAAVIHVPFRCPDCGDTFKFETLKDLRVHLEIEHTNVFANAWKDKKRHIPSSLFGSSSPILEMYHADAIRIEEDLLTHKRNELNNKQRRLDTLSSDRISNNTGGMSRSTIKKVDGRITNLESASFRKYGHSSRVAQKYLHKSKADKGSRFNEGHRSNKYFDDYLKDDESFQDVTQPKRSPRQIDNVHNISELSVRKPRNSNVNTLLSDSVSSDIDNHVRDTLTALSQEVVIGRANQHATADSLLASQEVYSCLEQSAQERLQKQQEIIATLALKLSEKDEKLADLTVKVNSLKNESAADEIKEILRFKSNQESEKMLQEELAYKQKELAALTKRVESARDAVLKCEKEIKDKSNEPGLNIKEDKTEYKTNTQEPEREKVTQNSVNAVDDNDLKEDIHQLKGEYDPFQLGQARIVEKGMLAKEKELVSLRSKSMQLETDRQTLLLEMQALLEIAANDNEKLRAELADQGKQLSKLNLELERSKQEQSELLGETNTLYFQADLSLSRLKHVLEERDSQLMSVSAQLDQAREMQGRLTKERQEYLKAAMEKEANYQAMVQENALQLKTMKESLDESQVEKEKLQENLKVLKNELDRKEQEDLQMEERMREMETQLTEHEAWQVSMKEQIKNKEERLHKAKRSMEQMNSFMSDTAERELEARSRLEQFISNLIDRSTQAESELKKLREAYTAKEEAFKTRTGAQLHVPNGTVSVHEGSWQSQPSWQKETREELKKLSSPQRRSPERPYEFLHRNSLDNLNTRLPHYFPFRQPDFDNEEENEPEEPTRLRSSINQVKKNESVDILPERHLKNRPLLVLGKEYPHPSAYELKKAKVNAAHRQPVDREENKDKDKPVRRSLYEDKFYLPVESDEYTLQPSLRSRPERQGKGKNTYSSSPKHHHQPRNKGNTHNLLNNSHLFKNTPEVEKMYQNVQKHSYTTNPANQLSKRNALNQDHRPRKEILDQLPMDEHGIIWALHDRSPPRMRTQKKKTRRRSNEKLSKKDNGSKSPFIDRHESDGDELRGSFDSDDDVHNLQKKDKENKPSTYSFLQSPIPLGDKINLLLTSMAPGAVTSNARKDYTKNAKMRPNNAADVKHTYNTSDSESQPGSPVHNARAVQERVQKLTTNKHNNDAVSPTPKSRNRLSHSIQNDQDPPHLTQSDISHMDELGRKRRDSNKVLAKDDSKLSASDSDQLKDDKSHSDTLITVIEKQADTSNYDVTRKNEQIIDKPEDSSIKETGQDQKVVIPTINEPNEIALHSDEIDGAVYQPSLLHPNFDHNEQLDSHNAESDFSSSSYTTVRNEQNRMTDFTEEEQAVKQNKRKVFAQVHAELEKQDSRGSLERENSVQDMTSSRERREQFQNMSSRESFARSKSLDSRRASLQKQESTQKSASYDMVMKELIQKHPYLNGTQEQEFSSASTENISASVEKRLDSVDRADSKDHEIGNDPVYNSRPDDDSTDNALVSSDDEQNNEQMTRRSSTPGRMSRMDTMEASTDTDLEKLAQPGTIQKPLEGKKKKRNSTWMKKEKSRKQKSQLKLKDMAVRKDWTTIDSNDPEEAEREDRLIKRRIRVALFCALAYADTESLLSVSQVCKDWRRIAHHPALWKNVEFKNAQISSQFLITLSQWCTQTQTLSLQELTGRTQKLMESEEDYNRTTRGSLEPGLERLLFACQGTLKSLSIQGCENILSDKCLWLVSSNCRMLSHLTYRSRLDPINPQLMWALGGGCPGVTSLYVHPYPDSNTKNAMDNRCLLQIGQFYRDLQEVGLGGMEFNMAGLLPFVQACQHLTSIHMDSCIALTDDLATALCRAGLKDLHTFTITGTAFQAKAIQTLNANCRHLKKIHATVTPQSCGLDLQKRKERNEYKKLVKGYQDLKKKAGLSYILTLDIQEPQ